MEFLGIDWEYTLNFWKKKLGLKRPEARKTPPAPKPKPAKKKVAPPKPVKDNNWKIFDPGHLISNKEFRDCNAMSEQEIQKFLEFKKGVILTNLEIDGHLVSYWLKKHCDELKLNPKIMLTHLQKEMGAITRKKPFKKQHHYDYIMGVGAYDGKWSDKWKGVDKQILGAAKTCIKWYERGEKNNKYPVNLKAGDRKDLMVKNSASYSLYKYTPWVGDKDKKIKTNKGYHTYKAPFGCYLFWKVYRGFFKK